jgi:hypothetical protein
VRVEDTFIYNFSKEASMEMAIWEALRRYKDNTAMRFGLIIRSVELL